MSFWTTGSHIGRHQRASFETLFPLVSDGELYIIEDVSSSYWPHWEGGLRRRGTIIEFMKGKIDEIHAHYQKRGLNTAESIPEIESIQFINSMIAVRKRRQLPRRMAMMPPSDVLFPLRAPRLPPELGKTALEALDLHIALDCDIATILFQGSLCVTPHRARKAVEVPLVLGVRFFPRAVIVGQTLQLRGYEIHTRSAEGVE